MAGLHELRFTEEKPLLRGQDTELVSGLSSSPLCHCLTYTLTPSSQWC